MNPLLKRILSAVVVVVIMAFTYKYFKTTGLVVFGFIVAVVGAFEFQKVVFVPLQMTQIQRTWFLMNCVLIILCHLFSYLPALAYFGLICVISTVGQLWLEKDDIENSRRLHFIALTLLGYVYCALLPVYALKTLQLPSGAEWFLFLCGLVFSGDVLAYFGGKFFGKNKLFVGISPNKTVEGAMAGIAGSMLAGVAISHQLLPFLPVAAVLGISFIGALLAQSGDLFESLFKRVADVKDSGQIMPGHGGALDRLDGLYFAAPLVYTAALTYTYTL